MWADREAAADGLTPWSARFASIVSTTRTPPPPHAWRARGSRNIASKICAAITITKSNKSRIFSIPTSLMPVLTLRWLSMHNTSKKLYVLILKWHILKKWQGVSIWTLIWLYLKMQHNTHFDSINWNYRQPLTPEWSPEPNSKCEDLSNKFEAHIKNIAISFILTVTKLVRYTGLWWLLPWSLSGESPSAVVIKSTDFHPSTLSRTVKIIKNRIKSNWSLFGKMPA
jgi:hypothetical protein